MTKTNKRLLTSILIFYSALAQASDIKLFHACSYSYSPYHDMTVNMSFSPEKQAQTALNLVNVSQATGIKSFTLAFIIDANKCTPAWDGQFTTASGWSSDLTTNMRAAGIQYFISFGGADGNDISKACSASALLAAYQQVINTYQPTGLDFDIENGTANVTNIMAALKTIQANNPTMKFSFTLPVMPNGLDSAGENVVKQAMNAGLNFVVNIMAMDYGSDYTGDMGQYAIQAATSTFNYLKTLYPQKTTAQLWQMIGITPMIGVNDVSSEIFTLANTTTLSTFATQNQLALLSMWSLDRDTPCSGSSASDTCSGDNVQTTPYEFSANFNCATTPPPPPPPPPPTTVCMQPVNITSSVSSNKKSVKLTWSAPTSGTAPANYEVHDWQNTLLWKGTSPTQLSYTDSSLPGKKGDFEYYIYTDCIDATQSAGVEYTVKINLKDQGVS